MSHHIQSDAQWHFVQNVAAISGDFHTHRLYAAFYDTFGAMIDGFTGTYVLCVEMAEALTDWEIANGMAMAYENLGTAWIEIVDKYVDALISRAIETQEIPNVTTPSAPSLQRLEKRRDGRRGMAAGSLASNAPAWSRRLTESKDTHRKTSLISQAA